MDDQHYCNDLVRRRDEDRWLSAQYASAEDRTRLTVLYAFHQELTQIPAAVSEPPLGEIRLQWWREALDEALSGQKVRAHPVVQALAQTGVVTAATRPILEEAIDARAPLLYNEGFTDEAAYRDWIGHAEGYLAAVRVMVSHGDEDDLAPDHDEEDADEDDSRLLVRAEALYGALKNPNNLTEPFQNSDLSAGADLLVALKPVFQKMSAARLAPHLHLSLLRQKSWRKPGPFAGVTKRVRLFTAMATGRF